MLSPYTIITCIFTGALFPLLGSLLALDLNVVDKPYYEGIILVMIGGFIAHYLLSHTIHDLVHLKIEKRETTSPTTLKILLVSSAVFYLLLLFIYHLKEAGLSWFFP